MSGTRYCMAGDDEDDILDHRSAPFPLKICDSSNSFSSIISKNDEGSSPESQTLLQATNQATIAAHSILNVGGTKTTAMETAKAAATSVLRSHIETEKGTSIGNSPKEWFIKRRIRKQAGVLASIALVKALKKRGIYENEEQSSTKTSNTETTTSSANTSKFSLFQKVKALTDLASRGRSEKSRKSAKEQSTTQSAAQNDILMPAKSMKSGMTRTGVSISAKSVKSGMAQSGISSLSPTSSISGSNIFKNVAIKVETSKASSPKRTPIQLVEADNEEPIYALNKKSCTQSSDNSVKQGYTHNLEEVVTNSSVTTFGMTASTMNTYPHGKPCSFDSLNPFKMFERLTCFSGNDEEVAHVPERIPERVPDRIPLQFPSSSYSAQDASTGEDSSILFSDSSSSYMYSRDSKIR